MTESVQQEWALKLPMQQQSVLLLALRGPDGFYKMHACKDLLRAYRAHVIKAAKYGRALRPGDVADKFMDLSKFYDAGAWKQAVDDWFSTFDELPIHYQAHLAHGAQILGHKHPDQVVRERWTAFYEKWCDALHVQPETLAAMDARLSDWNRSHWD